MICLGTAGWERENPIEPGMSYKYNNYIQVSCRTLSKTWHMLFFFLSFFLPISFPDVTSRPGCIN